MIDRGSPREGAPLVLRGVFTDELELESDEGEVAAALGFEGGVGQLLVAPADGRLRVTVGLGPRGRCEPHAVRRSLAALTQLRVSGRTVDVGQILGDLEQVLGRSAAVRMLASELSRFLLDGRLIGAPDADDWRLGVLEAEAVDAARSWANATAAELSPEAFVDAASRVASAEGLEIRVHDGKQLSSDGFGLICAVGSGSAHDSFLVDLEYRPDEPVAQICLVGKGVIFDTGGLSLKRPDEMAAMRMDKAGAAAVLAVMRVVKQLGTRVGVRALLPIVENMIGPNAVRPGDVATARNGQAVRIVDTDFEGRLILADALAYAGESDYDAVIDVATLTHQVVVALGSDVGGLFSSSDDLAGALGRAAFEAGEPLWRLPLHDGYKDQVVTPAGLKNHPETDTGRAITAALFLDRFVPASTPWAHLDISGPAWVGAASGDGATGFAVRTLLRYIQGLDAAAAALTDQVGSAKS